MLGDFLGARFLHGQPAHAGLFQVEQDRSGDSRTLGAYTVSAETSVGTFDVPVALFYKVEKPVHRVEDVPSVGESDKGLRGFDAVPLDAGLEKVAAPGQGDIVEQLDAGVVVFHRYEEWHAETIAVCIVHARVGEGAPGIGVARTLVAARPVLAGDLESEFIDGVGG